MTNALANIGLGNIDAMSSALTTVAQEVDTGAGKLILKITQDEEWLYGPENDEISDNVMINPASFRRGWIYWENSSVAGEVMASVTEDLPAKPGPQYQEQWSFDCATADGEQRVFKTSAMGGCEAVKIVAGAIGGQLRTDPGNPVAEAELCSTSYVNKKYGRTIVKPVFKIVGWHPIDGAVERIEPQKAPKRQARRRPA